MDIELSHLLTNIEHREGYEFIQALIRLHGTPIGYVTIPLVNSHYSAAALTKTILKKHGQAIIRQFLRDRLKVPLQPGELDSSPLLHMPHPMDNGRLSLVTVAICTRDRTYDLARCLDSLNHLNYPSLDILIVDNAPSNNSTERLVCTAYQNARYICEPRPGLDWARNRAIIEARGEIIAYTDDDAVVDPNWVSALAEIFSENAEVMAVTGLVVPYELETDAQILFERYGGFGRGFERKWYQMNQKSGKKAATLYGNAGKFGTGANMVYRRTLFDQIGYFNPALDVGTVTSGGGNLEMFFRIIKKGYILVYEPRAAVRHNHRRSCTQLQRQIATWDTGFYSYLVCSALAYPDERFAFIRLGLWRLRRQWRRYIYILLISLIRPASPLRDLILTELRNSFIGLFCYQKALRPADKITHTFGHITQATALSVSPSKTTILKRPNTIAVRTVDINQPLHALTDVLSYSSVRIFVARNGNLLGSVDIANCYQPIGTTRLRDAIVDAFTLKLLNLNHNLDMSLLQATTLAALTQHYSPIKDRTIPRLSKLSDDISVSIVVILQNQPNNLPNCLRCLVVQESQRQIEIIVVNNNSTSVSAVSIVAEFSNVVLVNESRKGQAYAYNKGFTTSKGDIVVTVDDHATMPTDWLEKLIAPFAQSNVMVVTGNILPMELETTAQILFERYFGLGRGFELLEVDKDWFTSFRRDAVPIENLGSMANAAFRATIFNHSQIGLIKETLGTGIPTNRSGDTYLFYKVLKAGYTLMYEPSAFVWHKHHDTMPALHRWIYDHSKDHAYHFTTLMCDRDLRALLQLAIGIPKTYLRRIVKRLFGKDPYPLWFILFEILGSLTGLLHY